MPGRSADAARLSSHTTDTTAVSTKTLEDTMLCTAVVAGFAVGLLLLGNRRR
jgi:hypothetical protein